MSFNKIKTTTIGNEKEKTTLNFLLVQLMNYMISPYSPPHLFIRLIYIFTSPHPHTYILCTIKYYFSLFITLCHVYFSQ